MGGPTSGIRWERLALSVRKMFVVARLFLSHSLAPIETWWLVRREADLAGRCELPVMQYVHWQIWVGGNDECCLLQLDLGLLGYAGFGIECSRQGNIGVLRAEPSTSIQGQKNRV